MVKTQEFEAEKIRIGVKNPISNVFKSYGLFLARNGSKSTFATQFSNIRKSQQVQPVTLVTLLTFSEFFSFNC